MTNDGILARILFHEFSPERWSRSGFAIR